ncbi:hypothetical protein PoB_001220800 [Plakobranchus ocellatus]|uniref:Uncharacterized protein n=1 Tax=Plakobranchus ocellatus TaxID=259542 RepID=A0AAV3YTY7_9GAST|nr:hypothetical protein PoB_001220800 [Plakobranchus ocellatus]
MGRQIEDLRNLLIYARANRRSTQSSQGTSVGFVRVILSLLMLSALRSLIHRASKGPVEKCRRRKLCGADPPPFGGYKASKSVSDDHR